MADKLLHLELHCHTVFSKDGLIEFEGLARAASRIGIHAIAITDHDTTEGAVEFERWVQQRGIDLKVIRGEEKTLADGTHLIGIFIREPISSTGVEDAIQEIKSQGGFVLAPHPFRGKDGVFRNGLDRLPLLQCHGAAFEIYNAKCSAAVNAQAHQLLGQLAPFAGSDAHYESDLGESMNVIPWRGDLKSSVSELLAGRGQCRLMGLPQSPSAPERKYAETYYRLRPFVALPAILKPLAKRCYRSFRNVTRGVGPKPLTEVYAR